jgi:hypothetical protein
MPASIHRGKVEGKPLILRFTSSLFIDVPLVVIAVGDVGSRDNKANTIKDIPQ